VDHGHDDLFGARGFGMCIDLLSAESEEIRTILLGDQARGGDSDSPAVVEPDQQMFGRGEIVPPGRLDRAEQAVSALHLRGF